MIETIVIVSLLLFYVGLILSSELFELRKPRDPRKTTKASTTIVIRIDTESEAALDLSRLIRTIRRSANVVLLDNQATSSVSKECRSFVQSKRWIRYYKPKSSTPYLRSLGTAANFFTSEKTIVLDSSMQFDKATMKELFQESDKLNDDEIVPIAVSVDDHSQLESVLLAIRTSFGQATMKCKSFVRLQKRDGGLYMSSTCIVSTSQIKSPAIRKRVRSIYIVKSTDVTLSIDGSLKPLKHLTSILILCTTAISIIQVLQTRQTTAFLIAWCIIAIGTALMVLLNGHVKKIVKINTVLMTIFLPTIILLQLILPLHTVKQQR